MRTFKEYLLEEGRFTEAELIELNENNFNIAIQFNNSELFNSYKNYFEI